ncbi:MAG: nicotinamide-nucleotide amidohydrolase family protein [bacterium]
MIARVLLVGDELLGGAASDRNVATIAIALGSRGVPVVGVEVVGDDVPLIAEAARRLASRCDVLVVTGGLGPTADDLTREGLAAALGVKVVVSEEALRQVIARYAERSVSTDGPGVRRQASVPEGTETVENPVGTAPGFTGRLGACRFWCLPGVPPEVVEMAGSVAKGLGELPPAWGWQRWVATAGIGETRVADRLDAGGFAPPEGVRLAYLPSPGGVRLRLAAPRGAPDEVLDGAEREVRRLLGSWALPLPGLAESLVRSFADRGATIATAESCTGGLLGARITDVPGSSSVYLGGIISYSNRVKVERLGVDPGLLEAYGAVSEPVARAMAEGARAAFGPSLAVADTGIAGPGGGTPQKPVGTVWIAVADDSGTEAVSFRFPGNREMVRERTVHKALELAYRRGEGSRT